MIDCSCIVVVTAHSGGAACKQYGQAIVGDCMMKILFVFLSFMISGFVFADMDEPTVDSNAELAAAKRLIDKKRYSVAIGKLQKLIDTDENNADAWNLLGYAARNNGQLKQSATAYSNALSIDPAHKGALEYQGELLIATGDIEAAQENLRKLAELCPAGCEEHDDLQTALEAAN